MMKTNSQTEHRKSLHTDIVNTAMGEFMAKGVRAVRMDDIAKMLHISKRTLYEVYSNKEELLLEVLKLQHETYVQRMTEFSVNPEHNVIDIIIEFYNLQIEWWMKCNPAYFMDLQKYRQVKIFFDSHNEELSISIERFFKRGIEEGLFLPNIDYKIFTEIGTASMEYIKKKRLITEYNVEYIFRNIILLYIRGISTTRGIAQLDAKFGAKR